jgi:hypothetical protein
MIIIFIKKNSLLSPLSFLLSRLSLVFTANPSSPTHLHPRPSLPIQRRRELRILETGSMPIKENNIREKKQNHWIEMKQKIKSKNQIKSENHPASEIKSKKRKQNRREETEPSAR